MGAKSAEGLESIVTSSRSFETIETFFRGRSLHLPETPKGYHVFELPKKGDSLGNMYFAVRPSPLQPGRWDSAIFWQSPSVANAVSELESYCKSVSCEREELNRISIPADVLYYGGYVLLAVAVAGDLIYRAVDLFIKAKPEEKLILGIGHGVVVALVGLAIWSFFELVEMDNHRSKGVPEGFRKRLEDGKAIRAAVGYVTS